MGISITVQQHRGGWAVFINGKPTSGRPTDKPTARARARLMRAAERQAYLEARAF